ncbi:MAG: DIP1984 family protein [Methanosarcinaceae archaeon]|nr:DIP1984 family protein [Methanosarcinaceae archaeon]
MKLAEALILRKEMQEKAIYLENRIKNNINGQEGEKPFEDPVKLISEFKDLQKDLTTLIQRINKTNAETKFSKNMTIADAIVERDGLNKISTSLRSFANTASEIQIRYSLSEIKQVCYIDVPKLQKEIDEIGKKSRELDTEIQSLNWNVDLL